MRVLGLLLLCPVVLLASLRVEVIVRDSSGAVVPGAQVRLEPLHRGAYTDGTGRAVFEAVPLGYYRLQVRALGFRAGEVALALRRDTVVELVLAPEAVALSTVTVEATAPSPLARGDGSVVVIGPRELDRHRGQSVAELLQSVPGAAVVSTGPAIAKPVLRGMMGERLLVLTDQVPLYGQNWGVEHAPELDPLLVESVEVLRGMAAVQYGTEALAGVVRFVPKPLSLQPGLRWGGRLELFSVNRQGAASLWGEGSIGGWAAQGVVGVRKAADSKTPHYGLANTAAEQYMAALSAERLLGRHAFVRGRFQVYEGRLGIFSGMHLGNLTDLQRALQSPRPLVERAQSYQIQPPYQDVRHLLGELSGSAGIGSQGQLHWLVAWQQNHRQEYDAHRFWNDSLQARFGARPAYDVTLTSWSVRAELEEPWLAGKFHVVLDARRQGSVSEGVMQFVPNFRGYLLGGGMWSEWLWGRWRVVWGVRGDLLWLRLWRSVAGQWRESRRQWLGGAMHGGIASVGEPLSYRISLATGWRAPTAIELFANGVHHGAALFEMGDSTLPAERAWMGEIGLGYHRAVWHIEASAFAYWFPRYIASLPTGEMILTVRGAFPGFRYRAVPAVIAGTELQLQAEALPWLRMEATVTALWGREWEQRSPLYGVPPPRGVLGAHVHLPSLAVFREPFGEIRCTVVGRAAASALDYAPPPPGYVLWDAAVGSELPWAGRRIIVAAEVRNLFNRAYRDYGSRLRYFADEPGRTLLLRLGWQW
jgi:iron complex outermembrane receptor protein